MFDQLQVFLDLTVTPERKSMLVRIDQVLKEVGVATHEDWLIDALERADEEETHNTLSAIEGTYRQTLAEVLQQFGVVVNDTVPLFALGEIVAGLHGVLDIEDPGRLRDLLSVEEDGLTILAKLLEDITPLTFTDVVLAVEDVSPDLLTRILEGLADEDEQDDIGDVGDVRQHRHRLQRFLEGRSALLVKQALETGFRIGTPFSCWVEQFQPQLETLAVDRLVLELVGFGLGAGLSETSLLEQVRVELEISIPDPHAITQADIVLTKQLERLFHDE